MVSALKSLVNSFQTPPEEKDKKIISGMNFPEMALLMERARTGSIAQLRAELSASPLTLTPEQQRVHEWALEYFETYLIRNEPSLWRALGKEGPLEAKNLLDALVGVQNQAILAQLQKYKSPILSRVTVYPDISSELERTADALVLAWQGVLPSKGSTPYEGLESQDPIDRMILEAVMKALWAKMSSPDRAELQSRGEKEKGWALQEMSRNESQSLRLKFADLARYGCVHRWTTHLAK